jgi:DUF971 family protein
MIQPIKIAETSDSSLAIDWSDGVATEFNAPNLRRACPCAACINEWTGEKILDEKKIPDDMTFTAMTLVGRYALNFVFSDGHDTGIFSFKYLRDMADKG